MNRRIELFAAALIAGGVLTAAAFAQDAAPAGAPAVFTADQATQGAQVYAAQCGTCHGAALEGVAGPALKGAAFKAMASAQALNALSLQQVIAQSMPQSDPGSLTADQYNQVTAYILQQNGYPAGTTPLTPDAAALKNIDLSK